MWSKIYQSIKKDGFLKTLYKSPNYFKSKISYLIEYLLVNIFYIKSKKIGVRNGVAVRGVELLDGNDVSQDIEAELVESIREFVRQKEDAVVVGAGAGISTVWMARRVGLNGSVIAYEAGGENIDNIKNTLELNQVSNIAEVHHASVGPTISVRGSAKNSDDLSAKDLPKCDILELDCEGAELDIIKKLEIQPRLIIVETHGIYEASEEDVTKELKNKNYNIIDRKPEIEEKGIIILVAEHQAK
jgi:hypothetical protein